jgi:hypothetical protein
MPWELFQISYDGPDPKPESLYVKETLKEIMEKENKELEWFVEEYGKDIGIKSYDTMLMIDQPKWNTDEVFAIPNTRFKVIDDGKTNHMYTVFIGTCLRWVSKMPKERYLQYLHKKILWHRGQKKETEERLIKSIKRNPNTVKVIRYHDEKIMLFRKQLDTAV